ncbi:conjugal transfer protein TraG [Hyphomicrobium nitrativorans NL23]|uniref:Conjugal transfer protein TraG n=1 Tax=Hyphomicrobium nitrativorans NL23 TaxID=1029756 RepID=V5SCL3_9HYPH|nr:type IV secretory system conjugative DNA transfer family protein [Hyphomicrobium nitrativorans]AHB47709.1 conjugal transfer protein TraG [Hyphomicrobium nitrativorans NL23]
MSEKPFLDPSFPPRGSGIPGRSESAPSTRWGHPWELSSNWDWQPGRVLLGHWQGRLIGIDDDRHVVTVAGTRAGKSSTVLIPNLCRYPGSVLVLDPKGELARATAGHRQRMGQRVYVLDPFGETEFATASHNPFDELESGSAQRIAADAAQIADALIIANNKDPHWTDSARNLVRGLSLHLLSTTSGATLRRVRALLNGTPAELDELFTAMTASTAFDGVVSNIGRSFLGKLEAGGRELQGILSTAQEQTAPLDDIVAITERSSFALSDLATDNVSIYVVLPGMRMGTHYRWMRLVIQLALAALERTRNTRGALPVWFVLEEFPSLGHMRSIETAAGLMAGFGVKLWSVLQDFTQLKTHYPKSWETFLGNAGIIQAFGNADLTTTEHLSRLLGSTQVFERQAVRLSGQAMSQGDTGIREHLRSVRLLDANEITMHFSRETNRQLVLAPGRPPIYMERLPHDFHEPLAS